jgi:hypothetical protein
LEIKALKERRREIEGKELPGVAAIRK